MVRLCIRRSCDPCALFEDAWFEVLLVRTNIVSEVRGGMSAIVGAVLDVFFDRHGHDMQQAGVQLQLHNGKSVRVFANLSAVIADEAALHAIYTCKGSSGLKPCLLCQNVFNSRMRPEIFTASPAGLAQPHTCVDIGRFVLHTPDTIAAIASRLERASSQMTSRDFSELQTRLGWNYSPHGVIMNPRWLQLIDPTRTSMFDWMHVYFVTGIFNVQVGQLMHVLRSHGISYASLHTYICKWHWPGHVSSSTANDVFSPKRAKASSDDKVLKATASECLSLFPVLAHFVQSMNSTALQQHAAAFLLLVKVVEMIQASARKPVSADTLRCAIGAHLRSFKALYGEEAMTPKFHYSVHFPVYLERYGMLPSCYVLERKHKLPKRFGNELRNTSIAWETSVMRDVTAHHLATLAGKALFQTQAALVNPHPARQRALSFLQAEFEAPGREFETSRVARINKYECCHVGDIVMVQIGDDRFIGEIAMHAALELDGDKHTFSSLWRWQFSSQGERSTKWIRTRLNPCMCMTDEILCACIWAGDGDIATVLKPHRV